MKRGFTLIELMIVVSILGIMAAIVLPHIQDHQQQARQAAAKDMLRTVRGQIELYKLEHNGRAPGYRMAMLVEIGPQLIGTTDVNGISSTSKVPSETYPFGPYLDRLPKNPFNGKTDVKYITGDFIPDDTTGWIYKRSTGEIRLNKKLADASGVAYVDY